ncbi:MAG: hypothetical protein IBJ09_05690 [Bacteroidia bacterium]|nr:hypothetical protein [Bacteroidia bacterium]
MENSSTLAEKLAEKVERLVNAHQALMEENLALQQAVAELRAERDEYIRRVADARQAEDNRLQEPGLISESNLKAEAIKQKLDVLIEETELCIRELKGYV